MNAINRLLSGRSPVQLRPGTQVFINTFAQFLLNCETSPRLTAPPAMVPPHPPIPTPHYQEYNLLVKYFVSTLPTQTFPNA